MFAEIRCAIDEEARLSTPAASLAPDADLYAAGLTPYSAVRLMLVLERRFGVEISRGALKRETMRSMESIAQALQGACAA